MHWSFLWCFAQFEIWVVKRRAHAGTYASKSIIFYLKSSCVDLDFAFLRRSAEFGWHTQNESVGFKSCFKFVSPYLLGNPNLDDTHRIPDHIGLTSNTYNGYSLIRLKKTGKGMDACIQISCLHRITPFIPFHLQIHPEILQRFASTNRELRIWIVRVRIQSMYTKNWPCTRRGLDHDES